MYALLALLLFALALFLLRTSARQRRDLGLPEGRVLYTDTGAQRRVEKPLYAEDLNLAGRPDYLVESEQGLVPVEVKSGRTPQQPFASHIFQLAAYCQLVQRNYKRRPAYGIIRYPEQSFTVEFTLDLEQRLIGLLEEMRAALDLAQLHRSHEQVRRCHSCGYGQLCDERL